MESCWLYVPLPCADPNVTRVSDANTVSVRGASRMNDTAQYSTTHRDVLRPLMGRILRRFSHRDTGQSIVEYGLIVAVIAALAGVGFGVMADAQRAYFAGLKDQFNPPPTEIGVTGAGFQPPPVTVACKQNTATTTLDCTGTISGHAGTLNWWLDGTDQTLCDGYVDCSIDLTLLGPGLHTVKGEERPQVPPVPPGWQPPGPGSVTFTL